MSESFFPLRVLHCALYLLSIQLLVSCVDDSVNGDLFCHWTLILKARESLTRGTFKALDEYVSKRQECAGKKL